MNFELKYDLRNPEPWRRPWVDVYQDFLDQVAWADEHGFDAVHLHEHHFSEDGYLPSPFVAAAAIAARTTRIRIRISLVLLPLKHPVQVAEEAAVLDIVSGGRLDLMVGAGSRPEEFAGYGIDLRQRPSLMEEGVEIIRRCWEEERFDFHGKHWQLDGVAVQPKPVQQPRPRIIMGGASPAAARRAARIADGFAPSSPAVLQDWREAMIAEGRDPDAQPALPMTPAIGPKNFLGVALDPDAAWARIAPHALYESNAYARWGGGTRKTVYELATDPEELRRSGSYGVLTPDEVIALGRELIAAGEPRRLLFHPMMAGLPREVGQESLHLVASQVMPAFAAERG